MKLSEMTKKEISSSELLIVAKKIAEEWGFDYDFETQEVIQDGKHE